MNISLSLGMYVLGRMKNSNVFSATETMLNILCRKEKKRNNTFLESNSCVLTHLTLWAPRQNTACLVKDLTLLTT